MGRTRESLFMLTKASHMYRKKFTQWRVNIMPWCGTSCISNNNFIETISLSKSIINHQNNWLLFQMFMEGGAHG
jgi:hypothetical protein